MLKFINIEWQQLENVDAILTQEGVDLNSIISINELGTYTRIWYIE